MVKHVVLRERSPIKIFLEVEVFDLVKNKEWVWGFVGRGESANADSFEDFEDGFSIDDWKRKEELEKKEKLKGKIFGVDHKNWWLKKTIKIQAERKNVANMYDDGDRAWQPVIYHLIALPPRKLGEKKFVRELKDEKGEWPKKVLLDTWDLRWPTEECLARIYVYSESEEAEYNKKKTENVIPLLNKILILKKEGKIECVVDRFVSI